MPHQPNQLVGPFLTHTFLNPADPNALGPKKKKQTDSSVVVQPSTTSTNALFPNGAQDSSSVLSPEEREIMADITLDPDDLNPSVAASAAATAAWAWAALASEPAVGNDDNDASSRAIVNKDANATKKILQQPQQQVRPL
jgi:hypothetical protein